MRNTLFFVAIMAFMMSSCEKDNVATNPVGVWKISKFMDDGKDETADFTNYTFDFQADGKLIAKIGNKTYTGVWNDNLSDEKMELKIQGTQNLDTINDDWLIVEITTTTLKLKDDDSEGGEIVFTKM
jgi:hypothetical protein